MIDLHAGMCSWCRGESCSLCVSSRCSCEGPHPLRQRRENEPQAPQKAKERPKVVPLRAPDRGCGCRDGCLIDPDDDRHGTVNGYNNRNCRCGECREAWRLDEGNRARTIAYRRRIGMQPAKQGRTCGLVATYNAGCRCDDCRRASREHRAKFRARKRTG